jgi:putative endonuclease
MTDNWGCYLLRSLNSNCTYIGATNNLELRLTKHNTGRGAKYTSGETWIVVLYVTGFDCKKTCLSFESHWKKLSKKRSNDRFKLFNVLNNTHYYSKDTVHNRIMDLFYYTHYMTIRNSTKCYLNNKYKYDWIYYPLTIKFHNSGMKSVQKLSWAKNLFIVFD